MKFRDLFYRVFHRKDARGTETTNQPDRERVDEAVAQKIMQDARRHRVATSAVDEESDDRG